MVNSINYQELIEDKANDKVSYNDELHKYWVKGTNLNCISVTTLIHQFTDFDEQFWSAYKTLESLIPQDKFLGIKPSLLDKKKFDPDIPKIFGIFPEHFEEKRLELIKEWDTKREESCIRGSKFHREQELFHLAGQTKELQQFKIGGTFKPITTNKLELGVKGVYPELLLSRISDDGKLRIAGQADLVIIDDSDVYILDYKTSKKIDTKAYFDRKTKKHQCLKYPLNNIQDTNFWHYTLQLSTYAWLIQKENPNFNIKMLVLLHYDHDGNTTTYECEYLKNDVERMLAFYKKQIEHDDFKRSREKIIF